MVIVFLLYLFVDDFFKMPSRVTFSEVNRRIKAINKSFGEIILVPQVSRNLMNPSNHLFLLPQNNLLPLVLGKLYLGKVSREGQLERVGFYSHFDCFQSTYVFLKLGPFFKAFKSDIQSKLFWVQTKGFHPWQV